MSPFEDDVWELYDRKHRLEPVARPRGRDARAAGAVLKRLWLSEAAGTTVLPLDDRRERLNPDLAGRPVLVRGDRLLFGGMGRLTENSVLSIKNKSYR